MGALGVVAVFALFLSTAAVWVDKVLFDSDRVATSVGDSLSRPDVSSGLADFLTEQIFELAQLERRSSGIVPEVLEPLLPAVQAVAEREVSERIEQLVTSDRGRAAIEEAARQSHRAAVSLLQGDPPPTGVTIADDTVSLDLLPLLLQGLEAVAETGLVPQVPLQLTSDGSVSGRIRQLELAFRVDLPDDFGQFEIYRGANVTKGQQSLDLARRSVTYLHRATVMVVLLTLVSAAACVGFARRRWRAIALLAAGSALVLLLQRVLVDRLVEETPNLLLDPVARTLVGSVVTTLTSSLTTALTAIVWISVAGAASAAGIGALTRRRSAT